jgi:drug/metabolite transporter (DMT)-like permease
MATLIKLASDRYPLGELVFFRSFFGLIPVLVWAAWRGQCGSVYYTQHIGRHFLRSLAGAAALFCGFEALSLLPLADATAIGYASPLMTVILAVLLLHERVRVYRWSAVAVGLLGVGVMLSDYVGPGASNVVQRSAFGAAVAVGGAFFNALAAIQVAGLVRYEPAATVIVYFSTFSALFGLATLPFGWSMPGPADTLILVGAGLCGGFGQVFVTQSYRYADASVIAPFDYTSMIWALVISLIVFSSWPSTMMLGGAAMVIAAGLFVIWREHRLGIERRA